MRITNNMITRNYTKSLHTNLSRLSTYNQQIISGRRFTNMSEDPAAGVRGMQTRRALERINGYRDNAQAAQSTFDAAETTMLQISGLSQTVQEKYVAAITGTMSEEDRGILANELDKVLDEMLLCANSRFSDKYMFGGTNSNVQPFEFDKENGILLYNGVDVSTIDKNHALFKDAAYIDLGVGMNFEGTGDPQLVNPNSAFKTTFVGLDFLGTGSENMLLILNDMVKELKKGSFDINKAAPLLEDFKNAAKNLNIAVTKLGADSQYLEFTLDRLESEELNLTNRLQTIEAKSADEAILDFKTQEYIYNAALQMGQRLLQPTLFNFIS